MSRFITATDTQAPIAPNRQSGFFESAVRTASRWAGYFLLVAFIVGIALVIF
jgi:hypothetical protein